MQVQANLTMTPELKSELRNMVHEEIASTIQGKMVTTKIPEYLNLGESAAFLNISRGTLTKIINKGAIKLVPFGRAKRISKKQLIEFMASREV